MLSRFRSALAAATILGAFAAPAWADEPQPVNVALLDMSAVAPRGMMPPGGWNGRGGYGMMGQGRMGQGWMGQGWKGGGNDDSRGRGQGRRGSGPGAQQGMGMGMGPGTRMGMMSLRTDKTTVKPGPVRFAITNWSAAMDHEMLIVPVADQAAPLPYDFGSQTVIEDDIEVLDEIELPPGQSGALEVDLKPGRYLLICNLPGHYLHGMVAPFTVAE
jgi:uncharacterized cupredoxin-like copper-binding protein